jgi:hypothetical protein
LIGGIVLAANHNINALAVLDCIKFLGCTQLIMLMMCGENKLMRKANLKWQGNQKVLYRCVQHGRHSWKIRISEFITDGQYTIYLVLVWLYKHQPLYYLLVNDICMYLLQDK